MIFGPRIHPKSEEEIEFLRENCQLVCETLALVGSHLKPGITGMDLDQMAEEFIRSKGSEPGFKGLYGFPATLCMSPNSAVVHGIPHNQPFREGDIISIDCGTFKNGYYGDAAYTFAIHPVKPEVEKLLKVTREALSLGIEMARPGKRVGDIGFAIQNHCERVHRYSIVRELVGHGLGRKLHEPPEIPNFGKKGKGVKLIENMTIAIEPMVNLGRKEVKQDPDGWTIYTRDGSPSAHFEHSVVVRSEGAELLSDHGIIDESVKNNEFLALI
jgi:methionyl aminopeptidase